MQNILFPIVGLFINIGKSVKHENYNNFIVKVANLSDLDTDPFLDIYEMLKAENSLKDENAVLLENFKEIIEIINGKIKKKSDRKMSVDFNFKFSWMNGKMLQKTMKFAFYVILIRKIEYYCRVNMVK